MTIEVPKHCRRLVRAYEAAGYTLVQSDHPNHLIRMETGFSGAPKAKEGAAPTIYITMKGALSLLPGNSPLAPPRSHVHSTGNRIPRYTKADRERARRLVFGTQEQSSSAPAK